MLIDYPGAKFREISGRTSYGDRYREACAPCLQVRLDAFSSFPGILACAITRHKGCDELSSSRGSECDATALALMKLVIT